MAKSRNDILFRFLGDTKSLDKASNKARGGFKDASKAGGVFQGALGGITRAVGALGIALGGREMLQWAGDALQLAIAADEVDSRFQTVFGSAKTFREELETWGNMAGVTVTAAEDLASSFGNLAQTQGISKDASAEFALKVAELAGDLASFKDLDPERVFLALNKGLLTTEKEGLKAFDLAISAAEVDTRALIIATKDGRTEITKADKAYASYEIAVEQAGSAIGDLEKTEDSLANRQRQMKASVKELQEAFGKELLKPIKQFSEAIETQSDSLEELGKVMGTVVRKGIEPVAEAMSDANKAMDAAEEPTSRWAAALNVANQVASQFSPALRILNIAIDAGGKAARDAALEMEEYKKGIEATAQAERDARGPSEDYIGFIKQIRDAQAESEKTNTAYAGGLLSIWGAATEATGGLQGLANEIGAAAAAMQKHLPVYREFADLARLAGITSLAGDPPAPAPANPVAAAQNQNDLQDLGGQTGG